MKGETLLNCNKCFQIQVYREEYALNTAPQSVIPQRVNKIFEQSKIKREPGLKFRLQFRTLDFLITDGRCMYISGSKRFSTLSDT